MILKYALILVLPLVSIWTSCKTTANNSSPSYANRATDLSTVKDQTCVNFKKLGDCILRLQGYEAEATVNAAFDKEIPKYIKILADYGTDFAATEDPSVKHIVESAKKNNLPHRELLALATYLGPEYGDINTALRGNEELWAAHQNVIYTAASALTHLKPLTFKGKVYRSERTNADKDVQLEETYKIGNFVVEQPFLSTTTNATLHFAESDIFPHQILLRYTIESKTGIAVSDFSPTKSEDEVLFTPGSVFKVKSFKRSVEDVVTDKETHKIFKANTLNIELEEIVL